MAWTSLVDNTAGSVLTAASVNAIRDNVDETCPAVAAAAGDIVYADAANSMGSRVAIGSDNSLLVSNGSAPVWRTPAADYDFSTGSSTTITATSFITFSGPVGFPTVTVTTGTAALIIVGARNVSNDTQGALVYGTFDVSGATTSAASAGRGWTHESDPAGTRSGQERSYLLTSLTAGSNVFKFAAQVSAGTGTIVDPYIIVIPL